jgi:hypothetical protein
MSYGIIFWGNSTGRTKIFQMQKRAIRLSQEARIEIFAKMYLKI